MKEIVITNAGLGMGFSTHAQSAAMRFIGIKARSKRARKEEDGRRRRRAKSLLIHPGMQSHPLTLKSELSLVTGQSQVQIHKTPLAKLQCMQNDDSPYKADVDTLCKCVKLTQQHCMFTR